MKRSCILGLFFILVLLMTGLPTRISARARGNEPLSQLFARIDPAAIPSGILYDRVLPLSQVDQFDGRDDAPPISLAHWRQIYDEMYRSSLSEPHWPGLSTLRSESRRSRREGVIPVAILNLKYDRVRESALEDGSLVVSGGRLALGEGDPFVEKRVFAASPLQEEAYRGARVTFAFENRLYITNDPAQRRTLEVDFDDGGGFHKIRIGERVAVSYRTTGKKTILFRLSLDDGTTLRGGAYFDVISLQVPTPDDTIAVTASIAHDGEFGTGEAYVYFSDLHSSLVSPIIVSEGFDLDNTMNWDELYTLLNQQNLAETIRGDGYDLVVLNFTDATDYLQKNAFVLVELIDQVRALAGADRDLVLVGPSMGGLVSRYALAYMETNALDHGVRLFVSFDSPHHGANIPLGLQYWLDFFSGQSAEAAFLLSRLDTPGARQMLAYHHTTPPGTTGESDSLRGAFETDLTALGDYPSGPRMIAVANGSGSGATQGFNAGDQIIDYEYNSLFVDIVGNVWAVPDMSSQMIFDGSINILFQTPENMQVTVSGTLPYDNAPGGSRNSMAQMDSTEAPFGDIVALHDNHCFIPSVSAVAFDTANLFYDLAADPDFILSTPFDATFFSPANEGHSEITPEIAAWLISEIEDGVTAIGDGAPVVLSRLRLEQNVPNPFNPDTRIGLVLDRPGRIRLTIHDARGGLISTLIDGEMPRGRRDVWWNGRNSKGQPVSSGVYFCRLVSEGRVLTRKMTLLR